MHPSGYIPGDRTASACRESPARLLAGRPGSNCSDRPRPACESPSPSMEMDPSGHTSAVLRGRSAELPG
jgi:hypothetical protein